MNQCTVYGYVIDGSCSPVEGVVVTASPATIPAIIHGTDYAIHVGEVSTITSSTGYFEFSLIQNVDFVISIYSLGFKERILVPEQITALLWSLTGVVPQVPGDNQPNNEEHW